MSPGYHPACFFPYPSAWENTRHTRHYGEVAMKRNLLADLSRAFIENMPEEIREAFEERAAIMEFDAGLSRQDAEASAYEDCKNRWLERIRK